MTINDALLNYLAYSLLQDDMRGVDDHEFREEIAQKKEASFQKIRRHLVKGGR